MSDALALYGQSSPVYPYDLSEVSRAEAAPLTTGDELPWQPVVQARINKLSCLKHDWDGRGSARVPTETLAFASSMLSSIMPPKGRAPSIIPLGDGGIQLVWREKGGEVDVEVTKPNSVTILYCDNETGLEMEWSATTDFTRLGDILWKVFKG